MNELIIFGEIPFSQSEVNSPLFVKKQLSRMDFTTDKSLLVRINSEGGDVDAGFAIYDMLRELSGSGVNITTQIDGRCASIATVILMAGDKRIGNKNFDPFVHSAYVTGEINQHNAKSLGDLLKQTDDRIANLFSQVTKQSKSIFLEMMKNETSISAKQAIELNFFHELKKTNNPKNMTFSQTIKNLLNPLFGIKNFAMYTATQELLETGTDAPSIEIGEKATINGESAKGEILMDNGQTFIFDDNGVLLEIKEAIEDPAPENKETELAITEIANSVKKLAEQFSEMKNNSETEATELKNSIEEISNKMVDADKVITSIKNLQGEPITDKKKNIGAGALDKYRK